MKRLVMLRVPEDTEALYVECLADGRTAWIDQKPTHIEKHKPVPRDDQLMRDLDEVTRSTLGSLERQEEHEGGLGHDGLALRHMAVRLREAAGLDDA